MLKMKSLVFLFVGIVLFSQCSTDPVQKDLLNYVNVELPKLAPLESESINAFGKVVGQNYTTDSALYAIVKNAVIPKYSDFTSKLQAVTPATDEVKAIHKEYVEAAQDQLEGFKYIVDAIDKQNGDEILKAKSDIDKAGSLIDQWKKDLMEDCKKHNVVLETK
jgi:hypothetical protein